MITSYETFENDLRVDFDTNIATPEALPVKYENQPFDPPQNAMWVSYSVLWGREDPTEYSEPMVTKPGVLFIGIYVPAETGSGATAELVDAISDYYRAVSRAGAEFRFPAKSGGRRDQEWWLTTLSCDFYAERFI